MATRLTPAQKGFLLSLYDTVSDDRYDPDGRGMFYTCYRWESRMACALQRRGLVEFADEGEPEQGSDYFEARLTLEGIEAVEKLRRDT